MSGKKNDDEKIPFEAAIDHAGFGVYSYLYVALSGCVIMAYSMVVYSSALILPTSRCDLETTVSQQGLIAAGPMVAMLIGGPPWGILGDVKGRRTTLIISLLCSGTLNIIASFSVNWIMFLVITFFASFMAAGQFSLGMTLVSESVPMAKRSVVVLLVTSILLLNQGVMAVLAIPVIPLTFSIYIPGLDIYWNSWRTLLVIYTVPSFLVALWLYFMTESPKFALAMQSEEKALEILRTIHRRNRTQGEFTVKGLLKEQEKKSDDQPKMRDQIVPLFQMPLLKYTVIVTLFFLFQQIGTFSVWMPTVVNQVMRMIDDGASMNQTLCSIMRSAQDLPPDPDAVPCALNVTAMVLVVIISSLQSIVNALVSLGVNSLGRRNTVIMITSICGACGILVNLIPNTYASIAFFVLFLLGIIVLALYTAIAVTLFPTHLRALAVALTMTGGRIGNIISVQVINFLLNNNCDVGFYVYASVYASSAILASFLPNDRKALPPPQQRANVEQAAE